MNEEPERLSNWGSSIRASTLHVAPRIPLPSRSPVTRAVHVPTVRHHTRMTS